MLENCEGTAAITESKNYTNEGPYKNVLAAKNKIIARIAENSNKRR